MIQGSMRVMPPIPSVYTAIGGPVTVLVQGEQHFL